MVKQEDWEEWVDTDDNSVPEEPVEDVEVVGDTSFEDVVDLVASGELGKGQAMRLAVEQLGFNHVEVQEAVVEKLNNR